MVEDTLKTHHNGIEAAWIGLPGIGKSQFALLLTLNALCVVFVPRILRVNFFRAMCYPVEIPMADALLHCCGNLTSTLTCTVFQHHYICRSVSS